MPRKRGRRGERKRRKVCPLLLPDNKCKRETTGERKEREKGTLRLFSAALRHLGRGTEKGREREKRERGASSFPLFLNRRRKKG